MISRNTEEKSVLIARFATFGDVLLTLPLAEALAGSSGVACVDILTSRAFAALLCYSPHYRTVYVFEDDRDRKSLVALTYDVVLDLHGRTAPLPAEAEAVLTGVRTHSRIGYAPGVAGYDLVLPARREDEHAVEFYARAADGLLDRPLGTGRIVRLPAHLNDLAGRLPDRPVAITPGARFGWKRWPEERYAELVRVLRDAGLAPILVGHPFDSGVIDRVRMLVPDVLVHIDTDERRTAAVLQSCGVSVANNSGHAHLAQIAGARVVCLHSHTLPSMWRPWGAGHRDLVGRPGACDCAGLTGYETPLPCGRAIPVADVVAAVLQLDSERDS